MLIKIPSLFCKGVVTLGTAIVSFLAYNGISNKPPLRALNLTEVSGGGQQLEGKRSESIEEVKTSTVLESVIQTLSSSNMGEFTTVKEIIGYKYSPSEGVVYEEKSKAELSKNGDIIQGLAGNDDWIDNFLKSFATPMYTRGYKSFVSSIEIEFEKELDNQMYSFWDIKGEGKKLYWISLGDIKRSENVEREYKDISEMIRLWFDKQDRDSKIRYAIMPSTAIKGLKITFLKTYNNREYFLTIEYLYDPKNNSPVLYSNYVYYSESDWWKGGYYQAEGNQGWQKHIGGVDYHLMGNPNSPINLSFVETFTKGNWEKLTRWWKLLAKCSEEKYCRQSLTDVKSTYIQLPVNYYRDKNLDTHSGNFHPLALLWQELNFSKTK